MQRYIDPKTIARIKDLPLVAKTIAEGFLHGLQPSMQRGVGIEFSQYRAYEEGDELNRMDWKLFARSDRYFVREAERESEIDIWFLLDTSRSMLQQSQQSEEGWKKLEYAKSLIASLSYLANKQGDSFGFMTLDSAKTKAIASDNNNQLMQSSCGERHWQKLLINLLSITDSPFFPAVETLTHQLEKLQKPSLIFVISDFYERNSEISDFLSKINTSLSEVVALQLFSRDEKEFNYNSAVRFKDLESNEEVLVSAKNAKSAYLNALRQFDQKLSTDLAHKNMAHCSLNIDSPLDVGLSEFLRHRNRVSR